MLNPVMTARKIEELQESHEEQYRNSVEEYLEERGWELVRVPIDVYNFSELWLYKKEVKDIGLCLVDPPSALQIEEQFDPQEEDE